MYLSKAEILPIFQLALTITQKVVHLLIVTLSVWHGNEYGTKTNQYGN